MHTVNKETNTEPLLSSNTNFVGHVPQISPLSPKTFPSNNSKHINNMPSSNKNVRKISSKIRITITIIYMAILSWFIREWSKRNKLCLTLLLGLIPVFFGGWYLMGLTNHNLPNNFTQKMESPDALKLVNNESIPHQGKRQNLIIDQSAIITEQLTAIYKQNAEPNNLRAEIIEIKHRLLSLGKNCGEEISKSVSLYIENTQNRAQYNNLNKGLSSTEVENSIIEVLTDILGLPRSFKRRSFKTSQKDISKWLRSEFVSKQGFEAKTSTIIMNLKSEFKGLAENHRESLMEEMAKIDLANDLEGEKANLVIQREEAAIRKEEAAIRKEEAAIRKEEAAIRKKEALMRREKDLIQRQEAVTQEHVSNIHRIVNEALAVYSADKTGLVDYATESSGGSILSTRGTKSYQSGTAELSIFGISLSNTPNTPRTILTPNVNPGNCWAFQNFPGCVVIKLKGPVKVDAFSYEHVNRKLVPDGKIDSAPKEFQVYGLDNEHDTDPVLIGEYIYDYHGSPLQFFAVQNVEQSFEVIELKIISNHGNPNFTCLYRFRVHGNSGIL